MSTSTKQWIRAWFEQRNPGKPIDDDANFYASGYVDSFGIIELIDALESQFAILFEDADFKLPAFRTIVGVSALVDERLAAQHRHG